MLKILRALPKGPLSSNTATLPGPAVRALCGEPIGARSEKHIRDNLGCLDFELSPEQRERLSAASPIDLGFPHSFLDSDHVRGLIHGETYALIDNHRHYLV